MTHRSLAARALVAIALATLLRPAPAVDAAPDAATLADLEAAFLERSGARLVFREDHLPAGHYYDRMLELARGDRVAAARIAVREVQKYPPGFLGDMGIEAIGVFQALVSDQGDGFRPYNERYGGYLYYGMWNGDDAIVAAHYTDGQLPLTLHHEIFHHVDGTWQGETDYDRHFRADDDRFEDAISGARPYPALAIDATDLQRLRGASQGHVLRAAVGDYASKNPGEDQAETARHLMAHLPDALVQMATRPELAGSQRMLHVLAQYQRALAHGPDASWFVDVALGRSERRAQTYALGRAIASQRARIRERWQPRANDTAFTVWGQEDDNGVNWTLRADIDRLAREVQALARVAGQDQESDVLLRAAVLTNLRLLSRYQRFIDHHWTITRGTQATFDRARMAMLDALPESDAAMAERLADASYQELAEHLSAGGTSSGPLTETRAPAARDNPHLAKVDRAISDPALRAAIRRVQPATVRFDNGSGVNIDASGLVLTAAHVVDREGARTTVRFPDGQRFNGTVTAIDHRLDLALVALERGRDLPFARVARAAPERGDRVVVIGQPGAYTPDGAPTHYHAWYVSVGHIRGFASERVDDQSLGGTAHDAWTYWGHSGSPLFDDRGRIVAMHNSWDSKTAMRHAVTWEAIVHFLERAPDR